MGVAIQGNITVDVPNRQVVVEQMQRLAIKADRVVLTFDIIKTLAANIILMELGAAPMVAGSPPGSGGGEGEGPAAGGEGTSSLRVM